MAETKHHSSEEWATPADEDTAQWNALPRDQQLKRLQVLLEKPESNNVSEFSFDEVVARALARSRVSADG